MQSRTSKKTFLASKNKNNTLCHIYELLCTECVLHKKSLHKSIVVKEPEYVMHLIVADLSPKLVVILTPPRTTISVAE